MTDSTIPQLADLPTHLIEKIRTIRLEFENDWTRWIDQMPRIEDKLDLVEPAARSVLLAELLACELDMRRQHGLSPVLSEFERRFPDRSWVKQLILAEEQTVDDRILMLEKTNETVDPSAPNSTSRKMGEPREAPHIADEYEILEELGRGGMGVVYKARHKNLDRIVALKMILPEAEADESELTRFRIEAEAVARLQHPNIVQLFEIGENEGRPFFSLEFCSGGNLATRLAQNPLPPREAAHLVETLARAVHAAHQARVLHRDLKPANVLLTSEGHPKLTDFGLAKKLDQESEQTRSGAILGTPSYMAPEQALADKQQLSIRTDVYALGALLYACLTGQPPFRGNSTWETIRMVIESEPVSPLALQPSISRDLETICLKCLTKTPENRYPSALALADDLKRFQDDLPIQARPIGRLKRLGRWCRRNPALGLTLAVAVVILLAGSTLSTLFGLQAVQEARDATNARNAETTARLEAERLAVAEGKALGLARDEQEKAERLAKQEAVARERAETAVYAGQLNLVQREWESGTVFRAQEILASCSPTKRGWEYAYLARMLTGSRLTIKRYRGAERRKSVIDRRGGDSQLCVSYNRQRIVTVRYDETNKPENTKPPVIEIRNSISGTILLEFESPSYYLAGRALGPHGRKLAFLADRKLQLWDLETSKQILSVKQPAAFLTSLIFDPRGARLAGIGRNPNVLIIDASTGKVERVLEGHTKPVLVARFSPDGKLLATGSDDGTIRLWDLETGKEQKKLIRHTQAVSALAFDPQGKRLVSGGSNRRGSGFPGELFVWDLTTDKLPRRGDLSHTDRITALDFSPDGKLIVSASADETLGIWGFLGEELHQGMKLKGHTHRVMGAAWSSTGNFIISSSEDGTIKVWDWKSPSMYRRFDRDWIEAIAFDPASSRIVSRGEKGLVIWDLETGKQLSRIDDDREGDVAWNSLGIVSASSGKTWKVALLNPETGKARSSGFTLKKSSHRGSFSPSGKFLAVGGYGSVLIRNVDTGKEVQRFMDRRLTNIEVVAWHPQESELAIGTLDHKLLILDRPTGKLRHVITAHTESVFDVEYSPNGRLLASCASSGLGITGEVKLWDPKTGKKLADLEGHHSGVKALAFSPDGKRLACVGQVTAKNGIYAHVCLWEMGTNQKTFSGQCGHTTSNCLAFSPNGKTLAWAGMDGLFVLDTIETTDADRPRKIDLGLEQP